jgi:putative NIF3 family GTP cyclohydrolase 1 type 2
VIEAAAEQGAQALLVHHGYFWRGEDPRLVGIKFRRIEGLVKRNINLFAYHLPLDVHPELGNNAQFAALSATGLAKALRLRLKHAPLLVGNKDRPLHRIAWCTGAAQDMLQEAIDNHCDAFISGEISERTTHLAREAGVLYAAAGHHASERYGVQALARAAGTALGIETFYIEDTNPV